MSEVVEYQNTEVFVSAEYNNLVKKFMMYPWPLTPACLISLVIDGHNNLAKSCVVFHDAKFKNIGRI